MTIGVGRVLNGLYHLQLTASNPIALQSFLLTFFPFSFVNNNTITKFDEYTLWNFRIGHSSITQRILNSIKKIHSWILVASNFCCDICPLAKHHRLLVPHLETKVTRPFEIVSVDIWGPNSKQAYNGCMYFLTIVNQFPRCTSIYTLKAKLEVRASLQNFFSIFENLFDTKIKTIRSDNGAEFQMPNIYQSKGVLHQLTCVGIPQQNALAECKHQHILNVARILNFQSDLSRKYWVDFVTTTI